MGSNFKEALTLFHEGQINKAKDICSKILKKEPNNIDILNFLGAIAFQNKNNSEAIHTFNKIIQINSNDFQAFYNRGNALLGLKKFEEALESYNKAIKIKPDYKRAYNNRGAVLKVLKRTKEALENYNQAIKIEPNNADLYNNRGTILLELKKFEEALVNYNQAIKLKPDYAEVYFNLGNVFKELNKTEESIKSYNHAIKIKPNYAEAYNNLGNMLNELNRTEEAVKCYKKIITINPNFDFLLGTLIYSKFILCDWTSIAKDLRELNNQVNNDNKLTPPFPTLSFYESPKIQKKASEIWVKEKFASTNILKSIKKKYSNKKIRIGYYSADFHDHVMSYLLINLFELHDKSTFEIFGFSFGPEKNDKTDQRIFNVFDKFINVNFKSDSEIAKLSRNLNINIAIDLMCFTQHNRFGIFVEKCAPIQINFLGYPGTSGSECIDYILADKTIIPEKFKKYYSEKIIYMPDSYKLDHPTRKVSDKIFIREELGLPKNGFVFCCFNKTYKITPNVFDIWMKILKQVKGSVLWLLEDNMTATSNLKLEANKRGVDAKRIIFAKRMKMSDHLARHKVADLFIDTFPYNAHTTASDGLWVGLPFLTFVGNTFASRVGASMLNAIGLPELITHSENEYKNKAIELATNSILLKKIKKKLERNKLYKPLFDAKLFTKNVESAYKKIYKKYDSNIPTENIEIK